MTTTRTAALSNTKEPASPTGAESHTDTGRAVYSGGGIAPDEMVKPGKITAAEARLSDSIFAFALELTTGRVAGFENYKVQGAIQFDHDLAADRFSGYGCGVQRIQTVCCQRSRFSK